MDYAQARSYVAEISKTGSVYGLETMSNLLDHLGNPQDQLKFIHIAGTNGKGSVVAYISTILQEAGYLVGRYISPTLFSYRERIQVNGAYIEREEFARLTEKAAEAMEQIRSEGKPMPTAFEFETAVSFLYFIEKKCDVVVLECGLGGRMDATNVVETSILNVLASISRDHTALLGDTLGEIAWNKAGIFRGGVPGVSAAQEPDAETAICKEAETIVCPVHFVDREEITDIQYGIECQSFSYHGFRNLKIALAGKHQIENAALALDAVLALREQGFAVGEDAIRRGFSNTRWKGRFSVMSKEPWVILDGAHNPDAARVLKASVEEYFPENRKIFVFGVFADKEYPQIIDMTAPLADHIITVQTPDNPRALPAEQLAEAVRKVNPSVESAGSVAEGVERAMEMAKGDDLVLIFGSLSFLSIAQDAVEKKKYRSRSE